MLDFRTSVNSAPDVYCIDFAHAQLLRGKLGTAGNLSPWHRLGRAAQNAAVCSWLRRVQADPTLYLCVAASLAHLPFGIGAVHKWPINLFSVNIHDKQDWFFTIFREAIFRYVKSKMRSAIWRYIFLTVYLTSLPHPNPCFALGVPLRSSVVRAVIYCLSNI